MKARRRRQAEQKCARAKIATSEAPKPLPPPPHPSLPPSLPLPRTATARPFLSAIFQTAENSFYAASLLVAEQRGLLGAVGAATAAV